MKLKLHSAATVIMMVLALLGAARSAYGQTPAGVPVWGKPDEAGNAQTRLYFFWSVHCPHRLEQQPMGKRRGYSGRPAGHGYRTDLHLR